MRRCKQRKRMKENTDNLLTNRFRHAIMISATNVSYRNEVAMRSKDESKFAEIVRFVDRYYEENGRSPSTREIAGEVGISYSMVSRYLSDLRDRGEIEYDGHRGIVTPAIRERTSMVRASSGGAIPCGPMNEAAEYKTEHICLPRELTGDGEFHLLTASGDSMINAGINDGDRVVVRLTSVANRGDIVACIYNGCETTLKRYYPEGNEIVLMPENDAYKPIRIVGADRENFAIQGVATMVIKKL